MSLAERAVLMRLAIGLPGEARQDQELSESIKSEHKLGKDAGKWLKQLYPKEALAKIKSLHNEFRDYHNSVTLPFDKGIGILPGKFIPEYGDKAREFALKLEPLVDEFVSDPWKWIRWAVEQHNGSFDPTLYPGCKENEPMVEAATGEKYTLDVDQFRARVKKQFRFRTDPLPVPQSKAFEDTIASLLGTDAQAVDNRVHQLARDSSALLLKRLLKPVAKMAEKLGEQPPLKKNGEQAEDIIFRDTLVENIQEIVRLASELNLTDDPVITGFIAECEKLTRYSPQVLRDDKATRAEAQKAADALAKKMADYQF